MDNKNLESVLIQAGYLTDEVFQGLFIQWSCEFSDTEVADKLGVSQSTVLRWTRGKNLPCTRLRAPILLALAGK